MKRFLPLEVTGPEGRARFREKLEVHRAIRRRRCRQRKRRVFIARILGRDRVKFE